MADVIVVDDHADSREMYGLFLRTKGFQVAEAANGLEALNWLEDHTPDAIVTDLAMPGMDGIELCRHVRRESRFDGTSVIALTGVALDEGAAADALNAGINLLLFKPCDPLRLLAELRELTDHARELRGWSDRTIERARSLQERSSALQARSRTLLSASSYDMAMARLRALYRLKPDLALSCQQLSTRLGVDTPTTALALRTLVAGGLLREAQAAPTSSRTRASGRDDPGR